MTIFKPNCGPRPLMGHRKFFLMKYICMLYAMQYSTKMISLIFVHNQTFVITTDTFVQKADYDHFSNARANIVNFEEAIKCNVRLVYAAVTCASEDDPISFGRLFKFIYLCC